MDTYKSRLLLYIILSGLLLPLLTGYFFFTKHQEWGKVENAFASLSLLSQLKSRSQSLNELVREKYLKGNSSFLHDEIKNLDFLKNEKEVLQIYVKKAFFLGGEAIENRYRFLCKEEHHPIFQEKEVLSGEYFQETLEVLEQPIQVDTEDLERILSLIEDDHSNGPQLLITDCQFVKKESPIGFEFFELDLKILKREFFE